MSELYPLFFEPIYKDYLWGGRRILEKFGRSKPPGVYAESWEISDRSCEMSIVANGKFRGEPLHTLVKSHSKDLFGHQTGLGSFPLILKLIDAHENLSIQVHPDDLDAKKWSLEAKTEAWVILDTTEDSVVYAGFNAVYFREEIEQKLSTREILTMMRTIPVERGDVVFIPGGRLHAIGRGCLALEIQQNSNTTYRVYDWDRLDDLGRPRDLHLDFAKKVIDYTDIESPNKDPKLLKDSNTHKKWSLLETPHFNIERWVLHSSIDWPQEGRFDLLFFCSGKGLMQCGSHSYPIKKGMTCLVPAHCQSLRLICDLDLEIFRFYLP